jgi:hypothetical protein
MVFPGPFQSDTNTQKINYYQSIIVVELALTIVAYFIIRIVHYVKWGYNEELPDDDADKAKDDGEDG